MQGRNKENKIKMIDKVYKDLLYGLSPLYKTILDEKALKENTTQ